MNLTQNISLELGFYISEDLISDILIQNCTIRGIIIIEEISKIPLLFIILIAVTMLLIHRNNKNGFLIIWYKKARDKVKGKKTKR